MKYLPRILGAGIVVGTLILGWQSVHGGPPTPSSTVAATVQWAPHSSPEVTGFRVYWGTSRTNLNNSMAVGTNSATVGPLLVTQPWFVTVTATNSHGLESPPSEIIEIPTIQPVTSLKLLFVVQTAVIVP